MGLLLRVRYACKVMAGQKIKKNKLHIYVSGLVNMVDKIIYIEKIVNNDRQQVTKEKTQ